MGTLPQNYTISGSVLDSLSSGWAKSGGTGTVTYSATQPTWPDATTGGLLFDQDTNGGSLVARKTLGAALDLSKTANIAIRFAEPVTSPQRIVFTMWMSGAFTAGFSYTINSSSFQVSPNQNTVVIDRAAFTVTGAGDWTNINILQVQCDSLGGTQSDVRVGAIYQNVYTRPKVVIWFDDGNASDFTNCYPILSALKLPANIAFYSDNLNAANFLSTAQCDTLYAAGWDFTNHTKTHPDLATLTAQQVADEFDQCTEVLQARGWTRGNEFAVYPQGSTNATVDAQASSRFLACRGGRNTFTNFQQSSFGGLDYPLRLVTKTTLDNATTSLAQARTALADCVRLGSQLHVFAHSVVNGGSSTTWELDASFTPFFQDVARLRDSNVLDVVTITELFNGLQLSRKTRSA
jgi:peptidoglycan/xylan/chitin deacetylase (PgdA/CDA1 family)